MHIRGKSPIILPESRIHIRLAGHDRSCTQDEGPTGLASSQPLQPFLASLHCRDGSLFRGSHIRAAVNCNGPPSQIALMTPPREVTALLSSVRNAEVIILMAGSSDDPVLRQLAILGSTLEQR